MENISQKLDLRPINQIDQQYMENALQILDDYQILTTASALVAHEFDLSKITLNDFKEWLTLISNSKNCILPMNQNRKLASLVLLNFYKIKSDSLTMMELILLIRLSKSNFLNMVVIMIQPLYLLEQIIAKNQLQNR